MRQFTKRDRALLVVLLFASLAAIFAFVVGRKPGGSVVVTVDGDVFGRYRLSEEQTVEITDIVGSVTNVLVIEENQAVMRRADCPDQLCVHQRAISRTGENIVCLPNRVVVTVEQAKEDGPDGFAR